MCCHVTTNPQHRRADASVSLLESASGGSGKNHVGSADKQVWERRAFPASTRANLPGLTLLYPGLKIRCHEAI